MENKATDSRVFYEHVSQIATELTKMQAGGLREYKLDMDHWHVLEAVAMGKARSEGDLVRTLGRNASFYSRAVDQLVRRGWLRKRLKPRRNIRFDLKITAKGWRVYDEIQVGFAKQLQHKLRLSPMKTKAMRSMCVRLMEFNQILRGDNNEVAVAPEQLQDEEAYHLDFGLTSEGENAGRPSGSPGP